MKAKYLQIIFYSIIFMSANLSADEEVPDMALLEFLGSFDTEDDQWLDPTLLVDDEIFEDDFTEGQKND
ncbi:hypothetical protein MNBD_GAMMA22-2769 [hydrothermal vent metagenome]|uniref:Uncharacterized protein n=1 Tax=hydrothermal vent metagenome TaxID=652676 RepID=A0A3B1ACR5_9ZZZZ